MNPNLPLYGLASGPNVNMLDNMLMAAGFPATDQPAVAKPSLVPQYTYSQDSALHQHAMNLVQPNTAAASTPSDPVHVIVYQNEAQQQQPISYKLPQLGSAVVQQPGQTFVSQAAASSGGQQYGSQARPASQTTTAQSSSQPRHVQSPAERKKDIVAQAMQEQKIFEENLPKSEPMTVKQEPGVAPTQSTMKSATANMKDIKPTLTAGGKIVPPGGSANQVKKTFNRTNAAARQQVVPRIAILEDEDDGLTCRLCLASYWYKKEIHEHLKTVHSIADPEKYDKEEKEKKMKKIKEEQQRHGLSRKQREERERRLAKLGKGKIKLTSPGVRPTQSPGQRPSFQYRDGAFICDLCKESFSDGNDMVTHWKSHVKKQQSDFKGKMQRRPLGRSRHYSSDERSSRSYKKGGGDGKKPRWTAYLLWSTRKRREVVVDHPDWSFAQIAKWISEEWKQIDADEKDDLQKEAEEMNELGIRKLPRDDDAPDPNKDTTDEDSDFEEGYRKKTKSSVKVKKEKKEGELYGDESDESDWEPEADVTPVQRENRSGRQRKRPSFFQEFESQENNLDSILAEFEQTQASEFGKPRKPKPPPKNPGEKKERKRKAPAIVIPEPEEPVEVEVLRSGRKRKVRRVMNAFLDEDDEEDKLRRGASSDDDDFEPPPEEEIERLEENDDLIEEDSELSGDSLDSSDDSSDDAVSELRRLSYDDALPPKKRARPKKILTDAEIEEATRAAMMKTSIEVIRVPKPGEEGGSGGAASEAGTKPSGLIIAKKSAPSLVVEPAKEGEATTSAEPATERNSLAAGAASSFPDPLNEEESSSAAEPSKETPKFQWVNETLDDDDEQEKGINKEPSEDALNPLAMEGSGPAAEKNPLEEGGGESGVREAVVTEEDALLATATAPPEPPVVTQAEPAPALPNGTDGMLGSEGKGLEELTGKPETGAGKVGLSEEDLLTGPAHNLDDTQYKADYVDPNLDDIFK